MEPEQTTGPSQQGGHLIRYLEGYEHLKILRPSSAYRQACSSYPCRISELVFGSLLASYILGFITAGTSHVKPDTGNALQQIFLFLNYLTISVCFSFLTAALYTTYHNSILTMPNVPIADLTTDFFIAILQALCFGVSIMSPQFFLASLGFLLIIAFWRQYVKFGKLARFYCKKVITEQTTGGRDQPAKADKFGIEWFDRSLKAVNNANDGALSGWTRVDGTNFIMAFTLFALGVAMADGGPEWITSQSFWLNSRLKPVDSEIFRTLLYLVIGTIFVLRTISILRAKSIALDDDGKLRIEKMDKPAADLAAELLKTAASNTK